MKLETVKLSDLKDHPRNYHEHPQDEVDHIIQSIRLHGIYRNVAIAKDGTILAGHGVTKAARQMGLETIDVVRLDLEPDDPRALQLLVGDNEIARQAMPDDRMLTDMLKELRDLDVGNLLGTGFDEAMLGALVMVTRPASEIRDAKEAAEWVGMPEYEEGEDSLKVIISFRSEAERSQFLTEYKLKPTSSKGAVLSIRWPNQDRDDVSSLKWGP